MTTLENTQTRELKPVLNRQYMNAARLVQQGVTDGVDHAVDHERDRLVALMARHYRRVATVFGNKTFKIVENSKSIYVPEIKGPKDEFWAELNLWMRVQAGSKITKVQGTTKKLITKVIRKGMQEGESHLEIAKRIRATGKIATPHRARTIVLTETHTAACKSVDAAIKSTRIEMEKEWLATMDKRTRPDHVAADGQRIVEGARFKVGMSLMEYPGDPAGGADQCVRCRCTCLYHTVKRMDRLKPYEPIANHPTEEQIDAIKAYTAKGGADAVRYPWNIEKREILEDFVTIAPVKSNEIVYRGIGFSEEEWGKVWKKWTTEGEIHSVKDLTSFSKDELRVLAYGPGRDVSLKLKMRSKTGIDLTSWSLYPEEQEVLFGKRLRFKIKKVDYKEPVGGIRYIEIEELKSE